jgi:hypothetical protein
MWNAIFTQYRDFKKLKAIFLSNKHLLHRIWMQTVGIFVHLSSAFDFWKSRESCWFFHIGRHLKSLHIRTEMHHLTCAIVHCSGVTVHPSIFSNSACWTLFNRKIACKKKEEQRNNRIFILMLNQRRGNAEGWALEGPVIISFLQRREHRLSKVCAFP